MTVHVVKMPDQIAPSRKGDWMQTYTGRQFWPMDPQPHEIEIEDIAHALSNLCRFGGHCRTFYSVAEHSVFCSDKAPAHLKKWALLHDASEAYLVDVPRPIKRYLQGYMEAEEKLQRAVATRFDLVWPMPPEIHTFDNGMLLAEQKHLMASPPADWNIPGTALDVKPLGARPEIAERWFLDAWERVR